MKEKTITIRKPDTKRSCNACCKTDSATMELCVGWPESCLVVAFCDECAEDVSEAIMARIDP